MAKKKDKSWIRKHWSDALLVIFIVLMIIPQTRTPIMVFVQRTFAFGPSTSGTEERVEEYNWPLYSANNKEINFSEAKNEVAFVNFWATWCPPCIAEMPYMQNLYNDYKDKVKFYFITDESPETIAHFMEKNDYDLPVIFNQVNPPHPFEAKALPTTFIIDKKGNVQVKKRGSARWDSKKIRDLLDQLVSQ